MSKLVPNHSIKKYFFIAAILQIVWGIVPSASHLVISEIPVELYIAIRWTISSLIFLCFLVITSKWIPKFNKKTFSVMILGVLGYGVGSFGTLISNFDNEMNANHYPFLVDYNNELTLWTHLAKANPEWKHFEQSQECLLVFTGPHSYISPTIYKNQLNVPTWNYTAVHLKCEVEIIHDPLEHINLMKRLVKNFEAKNGTQWNYSLPVDQHQKLLNAIVWLKFKPIKVEAKFKLSQNREKIDYHSVLDEFSTRQSNNDIELLKYMRLTMPKKMM